MTLNDPICIIYEQTNQSGFGHYSRSLKLAKYICGQGMSVELINIGDLNVNQGPPTETVIFDISSKANEKANELCAMTTRTVGLDWLQQSQVDYNILVYPHRGASAKKEVFVGFEYVIIEDEIRKLSPVNAKSGIKNALVLIGGGDLKGDSFKAGDYLQSHGFNVHVVLGALAKKPNENKSYSVSQNISNVAEVIREADIMVTNGGNCLFEALASGRPVIALAQTDAEERIIAEVNNYNAILGTELYDIKADKNVASIISNGLALVDGAGTKRIYNIIKQISG